MKIAEAFVELRTDTSKAKREAVDGARTIAQDMTKQFAQFFSAAIFVNEIGKAISAASELEQAVGGTGAIFGSASRIIDDYAKTSAEAAGLSERAFRTLTSQIGGLLTGLGFTQTEAANTSIELAQLGADLAATFGGKPEEAVQALGSALRGEFNPLERFGVSLNVAQANLKAVEMGLASSTSEVGLNERALATLQIITEKTAGAQGQFGREAETTAGKQAILTAKMEDLRATIGTSLLPVMEQALKILEFVLGAFDALPGPVQTAIVALAGIAVLSGPITNVARGLRGLTDVMGTLRSNGPRVAAAVGVVGAALIVQQAHAQNAARRNNEFADSLDEVARASDQDLLATFAESLLRGAFAGREAGDAIAELARENLGAAERVRDAVAATDDQAISIGGVTVTAKELTAALDTEIEAQQTANDATERSTSLLGDQKKATEEVILVIDDVADAYKDAEDAARDLTQALDDVIGRSLDLAGAQDEAIAAVQELTDDLDEESRSLDQNTVAGRTNRAAIREAAEAQLALGAEMVRSGDSTETATTKVNEMIGALRQQAIDAGLTESEVDEYLRTLNLTPSDITTAIQLVNQRTAMERINDLKVNMAEIPESIRTEIEAMIDLGDYYAAEQALNGLARARTAFVNVQQIITGAVNTAGGSFFRSAAGRYVDRFMVSSLGEEGPEAVLPLTRPSRLRELLSDPRIGDPVAAAMASDARTGSSPGGSGMPAASPGGMDPVTFGRTVARAIADELAVLERVR